MSPDIKSELAPEDSELTEQINKTLSANEEAAEKLANRKIRKNKREISRLNDLATCALIANKKHSYIYAIGKLRSFINKPLAADVLETLWKTSRESYEEIRDGRNLSKEAS